MSNLRSKIIELIVASPMYRIMKVPSDLIDVESAVRPMQTANDRFDHYCVECNRVVPFQLVRDENVARDMRLLGAITSGTLPHTDAMPEFFFKSAICQRDLNHSIEWAFRITPKGIVKFGQHPSPRDIGAKEIRRHEVLSKYQADSLAQALSLHGLGVGAGAFLYIRRVFESLVADAEKQARTDADWDAVAFEKAKMDGKIELLKDYLPSVLVSDRRLYGILSKGLHELSDEVCEANFDMVYQGILLIAESAQQKLDNEKRTRAYREARFVHTPDD